MFKCRPFQYLHQYELKNEFLFYFNHTDSLNDDVQSGKWETFGAAGGKLLQKILGTGVVTPVIKDAAADLTQALQGLASDTSQPSLDVSTITACLSSSTSQTLATGIQSVMKEASACNPFDASKIESEVTTLINSITDTEKACVNKTTAAVDLIKDYGTHWCRPKQDRKGNRELRDRTYLYHLRDHW